MSLKPLYLSLLLAAANAQAAPACGVNCPAPPAGFTAEQVFGSAAPSGYGDRVDITIDEYGHASSRKRISGSDNSDDQLRVYDNSIPGLNTRETIDYGDDYDYDDE
jgi:hypothetical protein